MAMAIIWLYFLKSFIPYFLGITLIVSDTNGQNANVLSDMAKIPVKHTCGSIVLRVAQKGRKGILGLVGTLFANSAFWPSIIFLQCICTVWIWWSHLIFFWSFTFCFRSGFLYRRSSQLLRLLFICWTVMNTSESLAKVYPFSLIT